MILCKERGERREERERENWESSYFNFSAILWEKKMVQLFEQELGAKKMNSPFLRCFKKCFENWSRSDYLTNQTNTFKFNNEMYNVYNTAQNLCPDVSEDTIIPRRLRH